LSQPKLRILSQLFYPELISTGQTLTELAEGLAERGVDIEVYCAPPSLTAQTVKSHIQHKGIHIYRVWATSFPKKNFFGKLSNHITFSISLFFTLLFKPKRPTLVVTNPPFLGVIAALINLIRRTPFLYLVFDVYPHTAIQLGVLKHHSLLSKLWRAMNRFVYRRASKIIVIGRCMEVIVKHDTPVSCQNKLITIPVWSDDTLIQKQRVSDKNIFKKQWDAENKFVVNYSGNMGRFHDIDTILKAAEDLKDHLDIVFVFSGDGYYRAHIQETIKHRALWNCRLYPYFPKDDYGAALSSADLGIVSLLESQLGLSVPSKSFGLMAASVPILGLLPDSSEIAQIIREENCGYLVHPENVDSMIETILYAKTHPEDRKKRGENGLNAIQKKYSLHHVVTSYYNEIILLQERY